jgi:hypothetical protein
MTFTDGIKEILLGKNITRDSWEDKRHYILMRDYILQLHKAGEDKELTHPWILSEEDLVAEDWTAL